MSTEINIAIVLLMAKLESATVVNENDKVILAKVHQLNMGSELYLKDLVRPEVLKSGRPTGINQEKVDKSSGFPQTHPGSSVRSVVEASSILQTTTCRLRTEHLLLKPYKAQFVQ